MRSASTTIPGVGTGKNWWDKIAGGGTGEGLDQNIMSAYNWLARNYAPGDRMSLFGFSRGAYTVRSLGGLICGHGLLDLRAVDVAADAWKRVGDVFAAYRKGVEFANPDSYAFHDRDATGIHLIGVWDTVGALGIPDDLALLGLLDNPERYRFHDTALSPKVAHARHALAIDERRASFAPTEWTASVAADHHEADLVSRRALRRRRRLCGDRPVGPHAGMDDRGSGGVRSRLQGQGHGSARARPTWRRARFLHRRLQGVEDQAAAGAADSEGAAILDTSTLGRNKNPPLLQGDYWPTKVLDVGESHTVDIYAAERWNSTGLYLEAGNTYELTASGEWVDHKDKFGPDGQEAAGFHLGDLVRAAGSALGEAETVFKSTTGREADFWWTRRDEDAPWFALMGFIANDTGEDVKTPAHGESFLIGTGKSRHPKARRLSLCLCQRRLAGLQQQSRQRGAHRQADGVSVQI